MIIAEIKEKMRLTTDDDMTVIYVVPQDKYNYTLYPIEDLTKAIPLTLDQFLRLRLGLMCFSEDLKSIIEADNVSRETVVE